MSMQEAAWFVNPIGVVARVREEISELREPPKRLARISRRGLDCLAAYSLAACTLTE
ncbi:hypothetical protein [Streptomyces sp. NPDC047079]|uniref:hypothetical protein n=1 Tax=Streptomyces sp. NPDC047079 TaxID=3154607 RepID=UPI0033D0CBAB